MTAIAAPQQFRTLFLSDFHLGTRGCQVRPLLNFLQSHDAETIYLVGDIIDGWRLQARWYWPDSHNDVLRCLMNKAQPRHPPGLPARQPRRVRPRLLLANSPATSNSPTR